MIEWIIAGVLIWYVYTSRERRDQDRNWLRFNFTALQDNELNDREALGRIENKLDAILLGESKAPNLPPAYPSKED